MKARSRRGGFEVTAIAMPAPFLFQGAQQPAGSVIVQGPMGGRRVYSAEAFDRLYLVTVRDAPLVDADADGSVALPRTHGGRVP
jgi:hypothetical protein